MVTFLDIIFKFVFDSLWFFLPSYIANVAPALVKKVNFLNSPVDFNLEIGSRRVLGSHKTWRGLFFGIVAAGILSFIQGRGPEVGLILGTGSLVGDLIGSFIKRRLNLEPGGKHLLLDELPGTITAILAAFIFGSLTLTVYQALFLILIGLPIHNYANVLWYSLKLKEVPW